MCGRDWSSDVCSSDLAGALQISLVTAGVARLTIDSVGAVTIPGNVIIQGDLDVQGAQNSNIALIVALG